MKKSQKNLNTAVQATFKDGTIKEYSSIEDASTDTGISVSAIKIRCNKPGTGGKDKTTFIWLDDYTARYYRSKKSRNKGRDFEYEIVDKLKSIGYSNVCRSAGESKSLDNNKVDIADPSGELNVAIQAKCCNNFPNYFNIKEECTDPREFVLLWKKAPKAGEASKGTVAVIDSEFFYRLLKLYKSNE